MNDLREVREKIIEELSCSICLELYNNERRRALPCKNGHLCCKACLKHQNVTIDALPGTDPTHKNTCPQCRQPIVDPTLTHGIREIPRLYETFLTYEKETEKRLIRIRKIN